MSFGAREARPVSSWEALRRSAAVLLMAGAGVLTPIALVTATSSPAAAESLTATVDLGFSPVAVATDPSGDIYLAEPDGAIDVWSPTSTTVYGTSVPADTVTLLVDEGDQPTDSLTYHDGDLWISSAVNGSGFVQVLSATGGNYFGVSVPADTATIIVNGIGAEQVAFDSSGNLYIANGGSETYNGGVYVLPVSTGSLYGQSVTADTLTQLTTDQAYGIAVDPTSGNIYYSTGNTAPQAVWALTDTSGTVFGVSVTADTPTQLFDSVGGLTFPYQGFNPDQMTLDSAGNLYVINAYTSVMVDAATSGTYVGTSVTADQPTQLNMAVDALQATFDSSGDLLLADVNDDAIVTATTPSASMSALYVTGPLSNPTITIDGSGFGSQPSGVPSSCSATGDDYMFSQFVLWDVQQGWQVGYPGDCIGIQVSSWTPTQVVFTFGSYYSNYTPISVGDTLLVGLQGDYENFPVGPLVNSVVPDVGPDSGGTTVTISGTGFTGASAVDFGSNSASYTVNSDSSITATSPEASTGTVDVTVTTSVGTSPTSSADQFTYTNDISSGYTCSVPGFGSASFPIDTTESPAPPASQDAGAGFQETLASEVTIPAPVDEYYAGLGATSLTLESQSTTENGLASPDGSASGAVDPSAETASATNIPQTLSPLGNAPITYSAANNPVTWQTGPGTGTVYLTPGDVSIVVTYVVSGSPTTSTISCTPPSNEGTLDTTVVNPAPAAATYQVPESSPPVQSQVTAGSDDGWTFTVSNTSQATVKGLQTQVTVSDGNPTPPSFDTTAITASGTKGCTVTSPGVLTCTENNLAAGASDTVNVLVDTSSLSDGAAVTGSAAVSSTNAGSATDGLGQFSIVTVNNGVEAVATGGIAVTSSSAPLSESGAAVTLKLPKKVPIVAGPMEPAVVPEASGGTGKAPEVGITLESLPPSDEPALCPPADGGCPGDIVEVEGNFSAFTSQAKPITAVIQIFYGASVPAGSVYMLKSSGSVVKLAACVKTGGDWNTPCVKGKQKTIGTAGDLSSQATVYFTGNDPGFSRR